MKITRVISFLQRKWLEPYIANRTARRRQAPTDFQRRLEKLAVVSVFGNEYFIVHYSESRYS